MPHAEGTACTALWQRRAGQVPELREKTLGQEPCKRVNELDSTESRGRRDWHSQIRRIALKSLVLILKGMDAFIFLILKDFIYLFILVSCVQEHIMLRYL